MSIRCTSCGLPSAARHCASEFRGTGFDRAHDRIATDGDQPPVMVRNAARYGRFRRFPRNIRSIRTGLAPGSARRSNAWRLLRFIVFSGRKVTRQVNRIVQQAQHIDHGRVARRANSIQHQMATSSPHSRDVKRHEAIGDFIAFPGPGDARSGRERLNGLGQGLGGSRGCGCRSRRPTRRRSCASTISWMSTGWERSRSRRWTRIRPRSDTARAQGRSWTRASSPRRRRRRTARASRTRRCAGGGAGDRAAWKCPNKPGFRATGWQRRCARLPIASAERRARVDGASASPATRVRRSVSGTARRWMRTRSAIADREGRQPRTTPQAIASSRCGTRASGRTGACNRGLARSQQDR